MSEAREEYGWLIEAGWSNGSQPDYWMGCYDPWATLRKEGHEQSFSCAQWPYALWTNDHMKAVRFARKEGAERVAASLHEEVRPRICDHSWNMEIVRESLSDA